MLIVFVPILAALGAAVAFRGQPARGLIVLMAANATNAAVAAVTGRWNWLAFSLAMVALGVVGLLTVRNEPEQAPDDEERDPDYCFTHKKLEPKEER